MHGILFSNQKGANYQYMQQCEWILKAHYVKKPHTKCYIFYDPIYTEFLEKETAQKEIISGVA